MTTDPEWIRPHPLTTVVLVASFVSGNVGPLLAAVVFGGSGFGFDTVAVVVGASTVGFGVLGWYMTGYVVTDEAVHHRSGVLNRQSRVVPLGRIQQVSIAEPVLARAVGLAVVEVAEASADGSIEIRYLGKADAAALAERLRSLARRQATPAAVGEAVSSLAPPPEPPSALLHETPIGALVRYNLGTVAPGLAGFAMVGLVVVVVLALGPGLVAAVPAAFVLAGAMLLAVALSTAGVVLTNGGFRLERSPRSLRIEAGLLSRRQVEVRPERIQTLTVSSGPIVRRLGLHQIAFSAATGRASTQNHAIVHLSPAVPTGDVTRIVRGAADVDAAFDVPLEPVSAVTVRREIVRSAMVYAVLLLPASVGLGFVHPVAAALPTVLFWPIAIWHARRRFARLGLSLDGQRLVVRDGVLTHRLTQVPLSHIQSVTTRASFFQRRLGLCSLDVSTAGIGPGNHVSVPDLTADRCREVAESLAHAAAASRWELRD